MTTSTVLTRTIARLLFAPIMVIAAAILVKGYADVGDGFSAGVVAALGVALQIFAFGRDEAGGLMPRRRAFGLAMAGLGVSLVVAFAPLLRGEALLTHAPAPGVEVTKLGSLELITAVAFDVGLALLVFGVVVGVLDTLAAAAEEDSG